MRSTFVAAILSGLLVAGTAWSQGGPRPTTLGIGDAAPALDMGHWVKGTPTKEYEEGKVYVLEFWATWCLPCIAGMPHLSKLQQEYGETVTVIGVSDEPLETVTGFLARRNRRDGRPNGDRIQYTLATDPDKSIRKDYYEAVGQTTIPFAFIIGKDARVEWMGHPQVMDQPLRAVVDDTWDRAAYKGQWERERRWPHDAQIAQRLIADATAQEDWDTVLAVLEKLGRDHPEQPMAQIVRYRLLVTQFDRPEESKQLGNAIVEANWSDAAALRAFAALIAGEDLIQQPDLDLALKAADRANALTESADSSALRTLALVHYRRGDIAGAITWQRSAVTRAASDQERQGLRQLLTQYEEDLKNAG